MRTFVLPFLILIATCSWGQEDYLFETRFRNPVDVHAFNTSPTMLLFVHPRCPNGTMCPTARMQKALECDSMGFRVRYGIKLFVICPKYSVVDERQFDDFSPINSELIFYTAPKYYGSFQEGTTTPHIVFNDGKGHMHSMTGGTIEDLKDSVEIKWRFGENTPCPVCKGTGSVKPNPRSNDPDLSVGICRRCSGGYLGRKSYY